MKYKTQNGWIKESMLAHIKSEFKGKSTQFEGSKRCLYRGANGRKCAVGMFILEDDYIPAMDHVGGSNDLFKEFPQLMREMPLEARAMGVLQIVHDESDPADTLNKMLEWVENNVE